LALLMAVPIHRQLEVLGFLDLYHLEKNGVIGWIINIENTGMSTIDIPNRVRQIISVSHRGATQRTDQGDKKTYQEIVKDNIINFIMKEEGSSLYRLVRTHKASLELSRSEQFPLTLGDFVQQ